MTAVNVPRFMNALLADLQAEAGRHGVRLLGDVSTEMTLETTQSVELQGALTQVIGTLLRSVRSRSSITLVTAYEPATGSEPEPLLRVQITGPALIAKVELEQDLLDMLRLLDGAFHKMNLASTEQSWSMTLTIKGVELTPTLHDSPTAVVVDDDLDTQEFLRAVLEMRGMQVISVSDGFDALLVIERYRPQVVLTDILMPNMNGLDLITRIKQAHPDTPVIVFSGFRDSLVNVIAGLPDVILPKPLTRELILNALAAVLPPS